MITPRDMPLSRRGASQALDGRATSGVEVVDRILAAAAAPGTGADLAQEDAALAMFRAASSPDPAAGVARSPRARRSATTTIGLGAAAAVLSVGGAAFAAGHLSSPVGQDPEPLPAPASPSHLPHDDAGAEHQHPLAGVPGALLGPATASPDSCDEYQDRWGAAITRPCVPHPTSVRPTSSPSVDAAPLEPPPAPVAPTKHPKKAEPTSPTQGDETDLQTKSDDQHQSGVQNKPSKPSKTPKPSKATKTPNPGKAETSAAPTPSDPAPTGDQSP